MSRHVLNDFEKKIRSLQLSRASHPRYFCKAFSSHDEIASYAISNWLSGGLVLWAVKFFVVIRENVVDVNWVRWKGAFYIVLFDFFVEVVFGIQAFSFFVFSSSNLHLKLLDIKCLKNEQFEN